MQVRIAVSLIFSLVCAVATGSVPSVSNSNSASVLQSFSRSTTLRQKSRVQGVDELQHDRFLQWAHPGDGPGVRFLDENGVLIDDDPRPEKYSLPRKIDIPLRIDLPKLTDEQVDRIRETSELYFQKFGRNTLSSFFWSGVETANPLTADGSYRWNSLGLAGLYDPTQRALFIQSLKNLGIRNLRFGLTNHEIFPVALKNLKVGQSWSLKDLEQGWDQESWRPFDEMIDDFYRAGIRISLDLHHFGIESFFAEDSQGRYDPSFKSYDPTRSFYLNPKWPDYFAEFALEAFRRYQGKLQAVTIINEPTITGDFNSQFWHGAFPTWSSPMNMHYQTARAIALGLAAIKARLKIESYIASLPPAQKQQARVLYLQSDGLGNIRYWPEYNRTFRFMTLDTVLGADWVLQTDFNRMKQMTVDELGIFASPRANPLQAIVMHTLFADHSEDLATKEKHRDELFDQLQILQNLHRRLKFEFHQSMQSYTILGIDYYSHNEDKDPLGNFISKEPQYYVDQIRAGQKTGIYMTSTDYWARYPMPLMITETGCAYWAWGSAWIQQMLWESSKFADSHIPFLGFTVYPAIDTWGWEHALSKPKEGSLLNESGIFNFQMQPKPYMRTVLDSLLQQLPPQ